MGTSEPCQPPVWGGSEHPLAPGRDSAAAALPGAEGCGCATPCPLLALVALLGWLCHNSIPVYVTGSLAKPGGHWKAASGFVILFFRLI